MVVIAIVSIVIALTLAGVQQVRAAASRSECKNRLKQLALAAQNYHTAHHRLPNGCGYPLLRSEADYKGHCGVSWQTQLLPFVEQEALWQRAWAAHLAAPNGASLEHVAVEQQAVKAFRCPADARAIGQTSDGKIRWGLSNYLGVAGTGKTFDDGVFHSNLVVTFGSITDGTSNTLLIGERPTGPNGFWSAWYANWGLLHCSSNVILPIRRGDWFPEPAANCRSVTTVFYSGQYDNACHLNHFWSLHPGGANFAFADGSVRFLSYSADAILPALATRAGGEVVSVE
jgi:prepilin-type processing-associated H-X9-DG protein